MIVTVMHIIVIVLITKQVDISLWMLLSALAMYVATCDYNIIIIIAMLKFCEINTSYISILPIKSYR